MNVGELREALAKLPDEWPVILQKDAEGNGYSPLSAAEQGLYEAETTWSGDVYVTHDELDRLLQTGGYWSEEDRAPEDAVPCVVLAPVN